MCGIFCEISNSSCGGQKSCVSRFINNRGPDNSGKIEVQVNKTITFLASVLWMQGTQCTHQPLETKNGYLLFNGDIFDKTWDPLKSDTLQIMEKIGCHHESDNVIEKIVDEIKKFKGPFSLIYYSKKSNDIIIARDRIGRNSLLFSMDNDKITISSVLGRSFDCFEIPAANIIVMNLCCDEIVLYPWESDNIQKQDLNDWYNNNLTWQSKPDEKFTINFDDNIDESEMDDIVSYIVSATSITNCSYSKMKYLIENKPIKGVIEKLTELLESSVQIRLEKQPARCKTCLKVENEICNHSAVAVLFSGGLDCTILAFLAHKYLPRNQSIDLLNVAFNKDGSSKYDVPDRITGLQSFSELKQLCPSRQWIFKEINVSKDELENFQKSTIADLVHPRQTILDESLGSALWFASRGQDETSTSPSRLLLLGSGADELFGGYTRHRNAFKRNSWNGLYKELQLDWKRISFRNLARDNRVLCDHGRQPRLPYLDEDFTKYVLSLKPWLKCFFNESFPPGLGDKLMLRLVAFNMGLTKVATFPKRALQFGSRIANKKEKGSDISKTFLLS